MKSSFESIQEFHCDSHLILYHQVSNRLYALNKTGQLIWNFYKKGLAERKIADYLAEEFTISSELALKDVETYILAWQQAGIFDTVDKSNDCPPRQPIFCETVKCGYSLPEDAHWYSYHFFKLAGRIIRGAFGDPQLETVLLSILNHLKVENDDSVHQSFRIWHEKGNFFVVIGNGTIHRTDSLHQAVGWIMFDLAEQAYRNLDSMSVLHGGAVGHGDSALILAGSKGSGKSTLIAALQHDGFEFLCDDICPLEKNQGLLVPVPMSLRLKTGSWAVLDHLYPSLKNLPVHSLPDCRVRYLSPTTGGPTSWNRSWPVTGLIFPAFNPETSADIHRLKPLEALKLLVESGSLGCGCARSLLDWLENTPSFAIRYSNLNEAKNYIASITAKIKPN